MRNVPTSDFESVPIIKLWGNLLVPLQGEVSDSQAERLQRELLQRIRASDVTGVVVDVSGVSVVDSHFCRLLANVTRAAQLMGAASVLCGLRPEIVMTLQAMDIELAEMQTALSLEEALERVGIRVQMDVHEGHEAETQGVDRPIRNSSNAPEAVRRETWNRK